ncbi:MAG: PDZ domain-containing protein [Acidimicrobiia bacterium]|nr:PDZ domain-containing protein [Acidimicrobiia bacterium]
MPPHDDSDDGGGFDPPLPPEDRLWRHPSEMAGAGAPGPGSPVQGHTPAARRVIWSTAIGAGVAGAALTLGVLAITGTFSGAVAEHVVEKVAVSPVVSSPLLRDDRGVTVVAERLGPALARLVLTQPEGPTTGTAVIIRSDGMLVTSARLIGDAEAIEVVLADGRRFEGQVRGLDSFTDVAVVQIAATDLPVAILGSSTDLVVGAPSVAIGSALESGSAPWVSSGVISALERRIPVGEESLHGMIQADTPIGATGGGGALVDANGSVIGILAPIGTAETTGFAFATPINLVGRVAAQLMTYGHAIHGWLGINCTDSSAATTLALDIDGGAEILGVRTESPAALAGLRAKDTITEIDGEPMESASSIVVAVRDHRPGDEIALGYWRDGQHIDAKLIVGEQPGTRR